MKTKTFLFILMIPSLLLTDCMAQIPNNGFEDWITVGNCMKPVGWYGTNDFSDTTGTYFGITRTTDHYPIDVGSYAIRLENNLSLLPDWAALGITWPGTLSGSDNPSFKIPGHPLTFCCYFKFFPQNNDTMRVFLLLYNAGNEVSSTRFETTVSYAEWTPLCLSIPVYEVADSARIMIAAFYPDGPAIPHGNSVLYIDNLSFDGLVSGIQPGLQNLHKIVVFPNPANDKISLAFDPATTGNYTLSILNVLGQQVFNTMLVHPGFSTSIDISGIEKGLYLMRLSDGATTVFEERIVINR